MRGAQIFTDVLLLKNSNFSGRLPFFCNLTESPCCWPVQDTFPLPGKRMGEQGGILGNEKSV